MEGVQGSGDVWATLLAVFEDPVVDEVLFNGMAGAWAVATGGGSRPVPGFADERSMIEWLQDFAESQGVRLDPLLGTAGGWVEAHALRWHCVLPPLTRDGPLVSFRRQRFGTLRLEDFEADAPTVASLRAAVAGRRNLLVAGPTGAGKTTLLAALLAEQASERVVVVESLPELPRFSPTCVRLLERQANLEGVGAVTLEHLVREALRLRPDRLVIGEIRGHEAAAFMEAGLTGHGGLMATIHGGSEAEALARLALLAGSERAPYLKALELGVVVLQRGAKPRLTFRP